MAKKCLVKLIDSNGIVFCNTLLDDSICKHCIEQNSLNLHGKCAKVVCPKSRSPKLVDQRKVNAGVVYACGENYGKNNHFVQDVDGITASLQTLTQIKAEVSQFRQNEQIARIRRVLHNIRTINGHSIQEIRALIPEKLLKMHRRDSCKEMEKIVEGKIPDVSLMFFRISKDLYEIKSEFSLYDKLIKGKAALDKRPYNLRDIIMLVLYSFFEDLNKKDVIVNVDNSFDTTMVDFETFQVATYHIIENASKYIRPHTEAYVTFEKTNELSTIKFTMQSLFIGESEKEVLFSEGYSGIEAKKSKRAGEGIGMFRARYLIELNGGGIVAIPGKNKINDNGLIYASNTFIISLPSESR